MPLPTTRSSVQVVLLMILVVFAISTPCSGLNSEKVDENLVPGPPDSGIKCAACSTYPPPLPPSPPPPSPPPPPPPPPQNPPKSDCPPPPPSQYPPKPDYSPPLSPPFDILAPPPGNLYPIDPDFSSAGMDSINKLLVSVGCCLFMLLTFWRL